MYHVLQEEALPIFVFYKFGLTKILMLAEVKVFIENLR